VAAVIRLGAVRGPPVAVEPSRIRIGTEPDILDLRDAGPPQPGRNVAGEVKQGVARALRDIRELGVCCSFGEWQKDVNDIAVPVRPGGGLPPMAINCGAPAYMVSRDFLLEKVRPRLIALASELETSLGTQA